MEGEVKDCAEDGFVCMSEIPGVLCLQLGSEMLTSRTIVYNIPCINESEQKDYNQRRETKPNLKRG